MSDTLRPTDTPNRQHSRRATWAGGTEAHAATKVRHKFEVKGARKHLERLEKAQEKGDLGVALNVSHTSYPILTFLTSDNSRLFTSDLPRSKITKA